MSGPHFRDYHLLLDEHADQLFAMTDPIAERIRKIGRLTPRSRSVSRRVLDNDAEYVEPLDMLAELADAQQDNGRKNLCERTSCRINIAMPPPRA